MKSPGVAMEAARDLNRHKYGGRGVLECWRSSLRAYWDPVDGQQWKWSGSQTWQSLSRRIERDDVGSRDEGIENEDGLSGLCPFEQQKKPWTEV